MVCLKEAKIKEKAKAKTGTHGLEKGKEKMVQCGARRVDGVQVKEEAKAREELVLQVAPHHHTLQMQVQEVSQARRKARGSKGIAEYAGDGATKDLSVRSAEVPMPWKKEKKRRKRVKKT